MLIKLFKKSFSLDRYAVFFDAHSPFFYFPVERIILITYYNIAYYNP